MPFERPHHMGHGDDGAEIHLEVAHHGQAAHVGVFAPPHVFVHRRRAGRDHDRIQRLVRLAREGEAHLPVRRRRVDPQHRRAAFALRVGVDEEREWRLAAVHIRGVAEHDSGILPSVLELLEQRRDLELVRLDRAIDLDQFVIAQLS